MSIAKNPHIHRENPCETCNHRVSQFYCKAFPTGIPGDILWGYHSHNEPYPNDGGIQYSGYGDPSWGSSNSISEYQINYFGEKLEPGKDYWGKPLIRGYTIYGDPIKKALASVEVANSITSHIKKAGFNDDQPRDEKGRWSSSGGSPAYKEAYAKYKKQFEGMTVAQINDEVRHKDGNINMVIQMWQGSSTSMAAYFLKEKVAEHEGFEGKNRFNMMNPAIEQQMKEKSKGAFEKIITDDMYAKLRAAGQAIMEKEGYPEKVTLYRGSSWNGFYQDEADGMSKMINTLADKGKTKTPADSLSSWTSLPSVAKTFASGGDLGIVQKITVNRSDILIPASLIRFREGKEQEHVVINHKGHDEIKSSNSAIVWPTRDKIADYREFNDSILKESYGDVKNFDKFFSRADKFLDAEKFKDTKLNISYLKKFEVIKAGFDENQPRDKSGRWTSGGAVSSKVKTTHKDMVLDYRGIADNLKTLSESNDWKAVKESHKWLKERIPQGELRIRADKDTAEAILIDGRFKAQYETGTSNGCYNPSYREEMEKRLFGKRYTSQKPVIYGYLENKGVLNTTANSYGEVMFILKDSVKARTSFTIGDSLGSSAKPTPILEPNIASLSPWNSSALTVMRGVKTITDVNEEFGYVEAQIHGGVSTTRDIERIHVNNIHDLSGGLYKKASAAGIPIYVSNVKEYRYSFDSHAKDAVKVSDIIHDKRYKDPYYLEGKHAKYTKAYNTLREKERNAMYTRDNKVREIEQTQPENTRQAYETYEHYEEQVNKYRLAVQRVSNTMDLYVNVDRIKTQMAGKQWIGPEW